jgi:hypothetical protein
MTVFKGFLIVILSSIAFALGGSVIGCTLGACLPGYYRAVFNSGREPWFDPVAVGLGQGLTQGLVCGVLVGAVIVLAVAWHNSRRRALDGEFQTPRVVGAANRSGGAQGIMPYPR